MPILLKGGEVFQGSDTVMPKIWSNGQAARWAFHGSNWDWSNITLDGSKSTFQFVPDPDNGFLQGDFSIGTGSATSAYPAKQSTYNYSPALYEVEPAGGTFSFSMLARELTYWHKVAPVFWSYQYTKADNSFNLNECEAYVTGGTDCKESHFYHITYTPADNRQVFVITYGILNTTDDTKNTTYQVNKSSSTDLTINFTIGPNNTPEVAYTEIWNVGFLNARESNREEYYSSNYYSAKHRNTPWHGSKVVTDDARIIHSSSTEKKEICMVKMWQLPNILYYVHMKFINPKYTDYDNPATANVLESWTNAWNDKDEDILVYIEFGISPNGGKTIWWNGVEGDENIGGDLGKKLRDRGLTTVVPTDIDKYITITQHDFTFLPNSTREADSTTSRYNIGDSSVHGTKAFKYVRFKITTSGENNEYYNIPHNIKQNYTMINEVDLETSTTATHSDDSDISADTKKRSGEYWAKYPNKSQSALLFNIGRKHTTKDWKTQVHLDLFYKNGSMKYIGSTSGN